MPKVYNKHHKNYPPTAIYVGRPSKWGNPFIVGKDGIRGECIKLYQEFIEQDAEFLAEVRSELKGKDLVCYCFPKACHADVLLRIANEE